MNRLIIIGNGFDLAHGIKTSFNDFIADYFVSVLTRFHKGKGYSDPLVELQYLVNNPWFFITPWPTTIKRDEIYQLMDNIINSNEFKFQFNSPLLERLYTKCSDLQWVDIEIEYFNLLLETKNAKDGIDQVSAIKEYNNQLDFLKKELIEYLTRQQKSYSNLFGRSPLIDCFLDKIYKAEVVTIKLTEDELPKNLYFLNFNYTSTFEDYYNECRHEIPSEFNYIHGNLSNAHGKPIFGFGDEFDKKYLEFEDEKNNELFKHIKSFEYLQTKNFYLLTRFIEAEDFQVHIYGHSCGLSDRTMLNQIFEHSNCKSIKIYYHNKEDGTNDFTEKTYEISRHFKDKTMLRKKLVPFGMSREMPQPVRY